MIASKLFWNLHATVTSSASVYTWAVREYGMGTCVQTLYMPRVPLWVSKKHNQANNRDSWYGKPDSLLAQTWQKLKNRQENQSF